jgi:nitroreductase
MPKQEKPVCSTFLTNLDWRRAVKKFSPGAVDYEPILQAIRSAPSSFGIQPYHVVILTNNPNKVSALKTAGIQVEQQSLEVFSNKFNEKYLATKEEKLGHTRGVR